MERELSPGQKMTSLCGRRRERGKFSIPSDGATSESPHFRVSDAYRAMKPGPCSTATTGGCGNSCKAATTACAQVLEGSSPLSASGIAPSRGKARDDDLGCAHRHGDQCPDPTRFCEPNCKKAKSSLSRGLTTGKPGSTFGGARPLPRKSDRGCDRTNPDVGPRQFETPYRYQVPEDACRAAASARLDIKIRHRENSAERTTRSKEQESMRRIERRRKGRQSGQLGGPGGPCLPHAVMHSRATRMAFAQGFALSSWPMPVTFIRLIAILLFGVVSARAVAEDSPSTRDLESTRSGSALRVQSAVHPNHILGAPSSPYWRDTSPRECGVPNAITMALPSRSRSIAAVQIPVGT